jgi:hypothetical protein
MSGIQYLSLNNPPLGGVSLLTLGGEAITAQLGPAQGLSPQSPAVLQGSIFIDPANSTGVASDGNPGSSTLPLKTWAGLLNIWGTAWPVFTLNTTVTFLSSHIDNSDPVIVHALCTKGAIFAIMGTTPTVTTSGVILAGTVAKNRAAGSNALLQTNLGATGTTSQLVQNTTHPSRAWTFAAQGANVFSMSQPFVLNNTAPAATAPAEVDGWVNGDTVNLLSPISINVAVFDCWVIDPNVGFTNTGQLLQCRVLDPLGVGSSPIVLNNVVCSEVDIQRVVTGISSAFNPNTQQIAFVSCILDGGIQIFGAGLSFIGGIGPGAAAVLKNMFGCAGNMDGDHISNGYNIVGAASLALGLVFVNTSNTCTNSNLLLQNVAYGSHVLYGRSATLGQWVLNGESRLFNSSGTFTAAITGPQMTGGIPLNNLTNAVSHTNAAPDVLNGNITTSVANLDAAAGAAGFGGKAIRWAGAQISNEG